MIFLIAQKMCRKLSWKRDFEIVFCLESADSNCTAVSEDGKIQNTKLRIERSTFLRQWKWYQYFSENIGPLEYHLYFSLLYEHCLSHNNLWQTKEDIESLCVNLCVELSFEYAWQLKWTKNPIRRTQFFQQDFSEIKYRWIGQKIAVFLNIPILNKKE